MDINLISTLIDEINISPDFLENFKKLTYFDQYFELDTIDRNNKLFIDEKKFDYDPLLEFVESSIPKLGDYFKEKFLSQKKELQASDYKEIICITILCAYIIFLLKEIGNIKNNKVISKYFFAN